MAIKIIQEKDIEVTQSEYDYFKSQWENLTHMVNPPTLESYIRANIDAHRAQIAQNKAMRNIYAPTNRQ